MFLHAASGTQTMSARLMSDWRLFALYMLAAGLVWSEEALNLCLMVFCVVQMGARCRTTFRGNSKGLYGFVPMCGNQADNEARRCWGQVLPETLEIVFAQRNYHVQTVASKIQRLHIISLHI